MAISPDFGPTRAHRAATTAAVLDAGLRAYMLRVYNWMASGLLLTGIVAYAIANYPALHQRCSIRLVTTPCGMAHAAARAGDDRDVRPAGLRAGAEHGGEPAVHARRRRRCIWVFCAAMGASLTNIFLIYTSEFDRAGVLHHRRDLRGDEHLRLHHARPT